MKSIATHRESSPRASPRISPSTASPRLLQHTMSTPLITTTSPSLAAHRHGMPHNPYLLPPAHRRVHLADGTTDQGVQYTRYSDGSMAASCDEYRKSDAWQSSLTMSYKRRSGPFGIISNPWAVAKNGSAAATVVTYCVMEREEGQRGVSTASPANRAPRIMCIDTHHLARADLHRWIPQ